MRYTAMKKIIALLLLLALLTGCTTATPPDTQSTTPSATVPTSESTGPTQTEPDVTQPSATEPEITEPPVTQPPVTEPPVTEPPVTEPPVTQPPVTEPPATQPPATQPPIIDLPTQSDQLRVHYIDVGQGDCALLECGGEYALIDAGYPESGPMIVDYLAQVGVDELALVVGSHAHGDHIGGLPDVLKAYSAGEIWSGEMTFFNSYIHAFQSAARAQGKTIRQPSLGEEFRLGEATITVIGPVKSGYEDLNDTSLVLMVQYEDTRFLFTGDMERLAEIDLLDSGADVKADVLKVGHHGSYSSTSYRFLREVAPTYAVISVGSGNDYGHPHREPISRLKDADVTIFRTDKMYTIVATSDGEEITFEWGNEFAKPWVPNAA